MELRNANRPIFSTVAHHTKKADAQTGTFGFCRHAMPTLKNQKKTLFFASTRTE